jgi:hypothetical protein
MPKKTKKMLKKIQQDGRVVSKHKKVRHPEFISGSLIQKMRKQVL